MRRSESEKRKDWKLAQIKGSSKEKDIILLNDNSSKRRMVETCAVRGKHILNPILEWSESDVWNFIYQQGLSYCELYNCGFSRLGLYWVSFGFDKA